MFLIELRSLMRRLRFGWHPGSGFSWVCGGGLGVSLLRRLCCIGQGFFVLSIYLRSPGVIKMTDSNSRCEREAGCSFKNSGAGAAAMSSASGLPATQLRWLRAWLFSPPAQHPVQMGE
jgi:hypothetical protein